MTELSDGVRRLLDGPNTAHLATILPDGSPHSVPVWIGVEGDRLAFLTAPGSRKARNVTRDPRVSVSVTDHAQPFTMAHIRGQVTGRVDGADAWVIIDRISAKYTGAPYPQRTDRMVFLIEPEHVRGTAYG
ncbi:MAG: PPOX class F420-dependent oxidoreductase [Trebonia sp.]